MPSTTLQSDMLTIATFNEQDPDHPSRFLHFSDFEDAAHAAVRQHVADLFVQFGSPLYGIFISGKGLTPHYARHVSEFFPQGGALQQRPDNLQAALDANLAALYEDQDILGTGDPQDLGTWLRAKSHIWPNPARNYNNDLDLLVPRVNGVGDFMSMVFDPRGTPPSSWWQEYI